MGVDYYVERGCPLQRSLKPQGFLAAMARRRQAQIFLGGEVLIDGQRYAVAKPAGAVPVHTLREGRVVESTVSADDVDGELAPWASKCDGCAARSRELPFGCYGYLGYPIAAATEEWLVGRALGMGVAAPVVVNVLDHMGIRGERVTRMRAQGGTFFEATTPCMGGWRLSDGQELLLSSDQLLELALFTLPQSFEQLFPLAAVLLALVPPDTSVERVVGWMKFPKMIAPLLVAPADEPEHQGVVDYMRQLIATARGGFGIVVDG